MSKTTKDQTEKMQGIANLIQYSEEYPKGAIKIGYHYYNISALIDALKDIKARSVLDLNKSDRLLLEILSGII